MVIVGVGGPNIGGGFELSARMNTEDRETIQDILMTLICELLRDLGGRF